MQRVFEKIIERLEDARPITWAHDYLGGKKDAFSEAIEIVNQVAVESGKSADEHDLMVVGALPSLYPLQDFEEEAIQRVVMSKSGGGWIPVSERLPEESLNSVLGWDEYRERCCFVQYLQGRWVLGNDIESVKIIAWQPLPPVYKAESEG